MSLDFAFTVFGQIKFLQKKMKEKINKRVLVGFTQSELTKLKLEYSNTNFNSFSRFMNHKLTNKYFINNEKNFAKIFFDLGKIGSNLNQIAKQINDVTIRVKKIDFQSFEELRNLIYEVKQLRKYLSTEEI